MNKTIILTYHNVVDAKNDLLLYDVSLSEFKKQVELLRNTQSAIRTTDILLTFDDGYKSWANEVLDVLVKNNLKAYFFICIKHIDEGKITKEDILRLKNAGMTIGSHTVSHRYLNTLSETEIFAEMGESKQMLEDIIGSEVAFFSVPYGNYSKKIMKVAQAVGYQAVFTSKIGINPRPSYILKRIAVKRYLILDEFKRIIEGKGIRTMAMNQKIKNAVKSVMGVERFHAVRNVVVRKAE